MKIIQKIIHRLFLRKITIPRWYLHFFMSMGVTIGIIIGGYVTTEKVQEIFAVNDSNKTWTINSDNSGDFTLGGGVSLSGSGATIANQFTNPGFESGTTGWTAFSEAASNVYGDGADGAITITSSSCTSGTCTIDSDAIASGRTYADAVAVDIDTNVSSGASTVVMSGDQSDIGFAAGDEVLIINIQGTSGNYTEVGEYDTVEIQSISYSDITDETTFTFTSTLSNSYDGTTQTVLMQRIPNYTNVTVENGGTLTASAWNGSSGGIVFFRATGTVDVQSGGSITVYRLGYRHGAGSTQGESYGGTGSVSTAANLGAGGGGSTCCTNRAGGGGAYGTDGENGILSGNTHGVGGTAYGAADLSKLYLGSGGGGNHDGFGYGGEGGGILYIGANTATISGTLSSDGENGVNHHGPGGAGSGGSLFIQAVAGTLGSGLVTADGGSGATNGYAAFSGDGGKGRVRIDAVFSGSTSPTHYGATYSQTSSLAYTDSNSMKVVAHASENAHLTQSINIGDTNTYRLTMYVYDGTAGNIGGTVDDTIAELYYNGSTVTTTYTDAGSGWWRLDGEITGADESRVIGLEVKQGKTIYADSAVYPSRTILYPTNTHNDTQTNTWDSFCEGTLSGSDCTETATTPTGTAIYYQICTDDVATCNGSNTWQYHNGSSWTTASNETSHRNVASDFTQAKMQALSTTNKDIAFKAILETVNEDAPTLPSVAIGYTTDTTNPTTNASSLSMKRVSGGESLSSNAWTNSEDPYFSWTAGEDDSSGSGILGYCMYLGTDSDGDPTTSKGLLGTSPVSTTGTTCQFIASGTSIDFATASYKGGTWLTTSNDPYYLNLKAVDNAGNVFTGSSVQFQFRFDNTAPSNPDYLSAPSEYISTKEASILWPTTGNDAASDSNSGVAGLQYRIGANGTWYGDSHTGDEDSDDLLANDGSYLTQQSPDFDNLNEGGNLVYLRTWDTAGNVTSTYISGSIKINTTAPSVPRNLTVTPSDATTNSYAFSWDAPTTYTGEASNITYCYTVNTLPTASTCSFTSAGQTSLTAGAYATQPGTNTLYVVAKDEAANVNYNIYTSVEFTYSGTAPGIPTGADIADISVKAQSDWKLAVSWSEPSNTGAGISTYKIYRSTSATSCSSGFSSFTNIGSTAGTSYSDTGLSQQTYYYCVKACDSANSCSAVSSTVSLYPDGKFTEPADLTSGPTASSITTQKATITWSTDRDSDSKVAFGTSSGSYFDEEPSKSTQTTDHTIVLNNLEPGTTYYYKAKWTDEDGNTGTSDEKTFKTDPPPEVIEPKVSNISISSAIVTFTAKNATKAKIYYGPTTSFGGVAEVSTSTLETTYTIQLTGLEDGTKYFYKINTLDSEDEEYDGSILEFSTLPRPEVSNVRIQELKQAANPTVLVTWQSNTDISSVITYYPEGNPGAARDEVDVARVSGRHRMILRGLQQNRRYVMIVKGVDRAGNEAQSDVQTFTTATDTRPPLISDLNVEGNVNVEQVQKEGKTVQLIVSWDTDEPSTSQVEYGEGTSASYSQQSQEDKNLTFNHIVIISGLRPSQVYHLRAISKDEAGNVGRSIDTVTIAPKVTDSAIDLVVKNLKETFGFLEVFEQ